MYYDIYNLISNLTNLVMNRDNKSHEESEYRRSQSQAQRPPKAGFARGEEVLVCDRNKPVARIIP